MDMQYFGNDKYRVLVCMSEHQTSVNNSMIIDLSQQEIANKLFLSKVKVNKIIRELKSDGYIMQMSPRGKYTLSDMATKELQK